MTDDIDQLVVEGTITTASDFSKTTKMKINRSATQTLYTFHETGFEGKIRSTTAVGGVPPRHYQLAA